MGTLMTINECLDEVQRLVNEGCNINEAINKVKGYSQTDQSIKNSNDNKINSIIALNEDIDNNEIYDRETGTTKRDLI